MYSKEVTTIILADFARGATAEETRQHLKDTLSIEPSLNTIYTHRHSITTEQLVDELQRQQERDITKEPNSDIRMFYRDKLLDKLMPLKQIIISKNVNQTEVNVNVTSNLLKQYENLFEEAALLEHCAPQPIHTTSPASSNGANGTDR